MSRYQFPSAATTDASLLVSGTLSDARLSANVALENVANVFTAKQSFSGVDHVGLCLNSLTTAQYNALTATNGDLFRDSTTDRIDARLSRGTVELIDSAGGQTIGGALTLSGLLDLRKAATANILQFSTTAFLRTDTSQLSIFDTGLGRSNISLWRSGNFVVGSTTLIAASSGADATGNVVDTSLSRNAAGVWQIGTTAANALGSLLLSNLTASGTVMLGGSSGPLLRNNAGVVETRSNDNSAYSGFACLAIQAGGNITCSSSNPTTILSSTTTDTNAVFQVSANGTSRGYYGRIGGNVGLFTGAGSAVLTHDTSSNITCAANLTASGTVTATTTSAISSGVASSLILNPTYNQTGSAGSADILVNRTETALGGSSQNFLELQVAGVIRSSIANSGVMTSQGIRLMQTAGGTARGLLNCPSWSTSYVSLQNATVAESAANSAINQSPTGETIVNSASGRSLFLRINNSTVGQVTSTGIAVTGTLSASGTLQVGGGTIVQTILSATATLDFPSISSNDTHTLTITVTGAVAGDSVFLGVPAALEAGLIFCASVTAANTVTVRMHNSSGGGVDPASGTFRATVIRF